MFKQILVPLDGSAFSEKALPFAQSLANKYDATITLLRVADHRDLHLITDSPELYQQVHMRETNEARAYLNDIAQSLGADSLTVSAEVVDGGGVPDVILDRIKRYEADLVVMSTHGRSGMQRFLMGSVAERVMRHATIPVMLVNVTSAENA